MMLSWTKIKSVIFLGIKTKKIFTRTKKKYKGLNKKWHIYKNVLKH